MNFNDLTSEQAEAYRSRVAADQRNRLRLLARLVDAQGGEIDSLDASVPSLKPLWDWFVGFVQVGMPGLPEATARFDEVEPAGPDFRAAGFAAELLAHYLYRVAETSFTGVAWRVMEAPGMASHHHIYVSYDNDEGGTGRSFVEEFARGITAMVRIGEPEFLDPDVLTNRFLSGPFLCGPRTAQRVLQIPRGPSILSPLLGEDPDPEGSLELDGPVDAAGSASPAIGGDFVLAHLAADMEALHSAPELPVGLIVSVLDGLGFRTSGGGRPAASEVSTHEFSEFVRGDDALVTVLAAGGRVRAVQVESVAPSTEAWDEIERAFRALAADVGGRFAPEDEF